ncbi:cysteine desulfurase family protein [Methylomonas methanica]|uniref:cysteine desulfurase n=1 Tax=Methylomonas methanica (strain DSM 25384 / MC09) TaxID=857087 RepID=F9ZYJ8_METMM|nr:cysteine desulfurase family protein [Methylomonas methanica]AEG02270.1 Cysteine desulfurase [Methylomonas methanica MC09]
MIYFDHNATTAVDERVVEVMLPYFRQLYGNPSSLYRLGRIARSAIDTAREQVGSLIDAPAEQILFTNGGTEANALALASAQGKRLWISAIEHPSVFENAHRRAKCFQSINALEVDTSGVVLFEAVEEQAIQAGDFVSLMLANNETGAIQPVERWVDKVKARGGLLHTDAVQALGKLPVSFKRLGVDLMTLSSHKIYGPKGCGALVWQAGVEMQPLIYGGDQERGLRSGTENVAAIVGFGKAAELARLELDARIKHAQSLRIYLEQQLKTISGLVIFAEQSERLPNTVQFGVPAVNGEMLLMQLDQKQIAVSSGSACAAGSEHISPVLAAMNVEATLAKSAIRVSLGKDNTQPEVDLFVSVLKTLLARN